MDQMGTEKRAEGFCYTHSTLNKAVQMTTLLHLNDDEAARRESEPGRLAPAVSGEAIDRSIIQHNPESWLLRDEQA